MKYFNLTEERNWGGPNFTFFVLKLYLDNLTDNQISNLMKKIDNIASNFDTIKKGLIEITRETDSLVKIAVKIKDEIKGIDINKDDPVILNIIESFENGLEDLFTNLSIKINDRFIHYPVIDFKIGERVEIINSQFEGIQAIVEDIDYEKGNLKLLLQLKAFDKVAIEKKDIYFKDVKHLDF